MAIVLLVENILITAKQEQVRPIGQYNNNSLKRGDRVLAKDVDH